MKTLREYNVNFAGLKDGKHQFEFPLDQKFIEGFETDIDFENYKGIARVELDKHSSFMEALISTKGTVTLDCDYTTEPFQQKVSNSFKLIIKFGEEFNDEDDEVLVLPQEAYQFNVAQYIYENIILSIPLKRICQECAKEMEEDEEISEDTPNTKENIDPRWDALKNLKNK